MVRFTVQSVSGHQHHPNPTMKTAKYSQASPEATSGSCCPVRTSVPDQEDRHRKAIQKIFRNMALHFSSELAENEASPQPDFL